MTREEIKAEFQKQFPYEVGGAKYYLILNFAEHISKLTKHETLFEVMQAIKETDAHLFDHQGG